MPVPETLRLRIARPHDGPRIRDIAHAAYAKYVSRIGREPAPMTADYDAHIAEGHAVVVEIAQQVCGYMIAWADEDAFVIDNLGVVPSHQGRGLGRRLIEHAIAEAGRLGLPALRLYTNELMSENRAMYRRLGFEETHYSFEEGFRRVHLRRTLATSA